MVSHRGPAALSFLALGLLVAACTEETPIDEPIEVKVVLEASSPVVGEGEDPPGDTIAGDTLRLTVLVIQGNDTSESAATFETVKDDPDIIALLTNPDRAVLGGTLAVDTIRANVTQAIGGTPVFTELVVPVDSFIFTVTASSDALNAGGQPLVGDTVTYRLTAEKARSGQTVPVTGAVFSSDDASVIDFFNDSTAVFESDGTATISVVITGAPVLPGPPGQPLQGVQLETDVASFSSFLEITSQTGTFIQDGDTLLNDMVNIAGKVVIDGVTMDVSDDTLTSDNPGVVQVLNQTAGTAQFVDTGTAIVRMRFAEPAAPRREIVDTIRVSTYRVDVSGPDSPVMGDSESYTFSVVDTRDDTQVMNPTLQSWVSSDTRVASVTDQSTGTVFARDTGQATITAIVSSPALPDSMPRGGMDIDIVQELFYGGVSSNSGGFRDTIRFQSSQVHRFTSSSRVEFSNGAVAYVDSTGPNQIRAIIGAGNDSINTLPLTLRNLIDEDGDPRDPVPTKFDFSGDGGIDDQFEPNDAMPLTGGLEIMRANLPFVALLSSDHREVSPPDSDYFYIDATAEGFTIDVTAEWQQAADLDFYVCNGDQNPPTIRTAGCARSPAANTTDLSGESETGISLGPGVHIVAFYCVNCPPDVPLTYRVEIREP